MSIYKVTDSCDGWEKCFKKEADALEAAKTREEFLHTKYCVEKTVPVRGCLCVSSKGLEECGSHHYARTVLPHKPKDCTIIDGSVFVEEMEIY